MKKLFLTLLTISLSLSAMAQISIKSTSSASERFYKDTWVTVTWNGSSFLFNSIDPVTGLTETFTLGSDRQTAVGTLQQLLDWNDSAEKRSAISFENNGKEFTIYKYDNIQLVITTGDAEYAQREYSRRMTNAFIGGPKYERKEQTPHFSYIQRKVFVKSIEAINALTDSKYDIKTVSVQEKTSSQTDSTIVN